MQTKKKSSRSPLSLHGRALGLLARRDHSRRELGAKLARHAEPADDIPALLDDLEQRKLLSDERFAEARARSLSKRYGSTRIRQDLTQRGVASNLAKQASGAVRSSDVERARAIWTKRFGSPPTDALQRGKQMRFLAMRGFPFDVIRQVIGGVSDGE